MSTRTQRWQSHLDRLSPFRRFILKFTISRLYNIRNDFASRYIAGNGYEIGAQNSPLKCKHASQTKYIDYLSKKESSEKYNIPENKCVDVDIIADANNLDMIPPNSAAFIIANHVLEHSPNPLAAMYGWLQILQTKGILFLTLPNYQSNEFDFEKSPAGITHLTEDYQRSKNNEDILTKHIYEHIQLIDGISPNNSTLFQQRYDEIIQSNLHTHYHVFNKENSLALLKFIHQQTPIKVLNSLSFPNSFELLFIIEKCDPGLQGPLTVRKDRLFNFSVILKNIVTLLFIRIFSKQ
jgi:SAM-dependent methyltransferase